MTPHPCLNAKILYFDGKHRTWSPFSYLKAFQESSRAPQGTPRLAKEPKGTPKQPTRRPQTSQGTRRRPKAPQKRPRAFQRSQSRHPKAPQCIPRRPKKAQGIPKQQTGIQSPPKARQRRPPNTQRKPNKTKYIHKLAINRTSGRYVILLYMGGIEFIVCHAAVWTHGWHILARHSITATHMVHSG